MSRRKKKRADAPRRRWRRVILTLACIAILAGAGWALRIVLLPGAAARTAPAAPPAAAAPAAPVPQALPVSTDYTHRVVAYVYENQPVTRADLGEYLIARHGPEKLAVMVNKGLIEQAARARGIEVTAGEIESALAESARDLNLDRAQFERNLYGRYRMNLTEWKEEVLRPRLLLTKVARDQVSVTSEELQQAFEANYGEKVECRIILYPPTEAGKNQAVAEYGTICASPEAFEKKAKDQYRKDLAACAGQIKPFGRYEMEDPELDRVAFNLRPGEVSQVVPSKQGPVVLWCLGRKPADTSARFDAVREKLFKALVEKKANQKMVDEGKRLKDNAHPKLLLTRPAPGSPPVMPAGSGEPQPGQVVAWYNDNVPITREELGEYLITCFGEESLEFLVNRLVIDKECAALGISVTEQEIDAGLQEDLKKLSDSVNRPGLTEKVFVEEFLGMYRKTLYEYREDAVRPRLLLTKMCQNRVKVTDVDLRMAFEAHHGEKLECRMILWPPDQLKFAIQDYNSVRDSEEAFAQKAKQQASPSLAAKGGKLPIFGRWSMDNCKVLGQPSLEEEAFKLQPGEVSPLIGTPQGHAVIKCDRRIPPDTSVTLEQVRPELEKEVRDRKVQMEMAVVFGDLKKKANPQLMLRNPNKPIDVQAETHRALSDLSPEERQRLLGVPTIRSPAPAH